MSLDGPFEVYGEILFHIVSPTGTERIPVLPCASGQTHCHGLRKRPNMSHARRSALSGL